MSLKTIPYRETGFFSKLVCDYLAEKDELLSFYNRFPKLENFEKQLEEKLYRPYDMEDIECLNN